TVTGNQSGSLASRLIVAGGGGGAGQGSFDCDPAGLSGSGGDAGSAGGPGGPCPGVGGGGGGGGGGPSARWGGRAPRGGAGALGPPALAIRARWGLAAEAADSTAAVVAAATMAVAAAEISYKAPLSRTRGEGAAAPTWCQTAAPRPWTTAAIR